MSDTLTRFNSGRRGHGPKRPRCPILPIRFLCVAPHLWMGLPPGAISP